MINQHSNFIDEGLAWLAILTFVISMIMLLIGGYNTEFGEVSLGIVVFSVIHFIQYAFFSQHQTSGGRFGCAVLPALGVLIINVMLMFTGSFIWALLSLVFYGLTWVLGSLTEYMQYWS